MPVPLFLNPMMISNTMVPDSSQTPTPLQSCPALVLAGGLGTRLRTVYRNGPKCMAPVGGRPFLEYLLCWLRASGIRDLVMCVGYKSSQIQRWLGDGSAKGFRVRYSVEEELCGTAGALRLAAKMVGAPTCVVLNGDSFLELDLEEIYRFHLSNQALATIALAMVEDAERYGSVQFNRDGKIAAFMEKSQEGAMQASGSRSSQFINGGVYLLQRQLLDSIPFGQGVSLEKKIFPELVEGGLYGFPAPGFFIDIGVPADFIKAQVELVRRFSA